jgi:MFS family permease
MGNSVVYLISLRRKYNPNLTFSYGYFLIPIMDLVLCLTSPIGGIIEDKIGGKKTILLSTSIVCGSFLLMYFSKNIFFDYLIMCLIGIGLAVGINITRKNVCSFFLNRKALISGILFWFLVFCVLD